MPKTVRLRSVRMGLLEANMEIHNKGNDQVSRFLTRVPVESVTVSCAVSSLSFNSFHFTTHNQVSEAA